jgi:cytochrome c oxidase subunit 4
MAERPAAHEPAHPTAFTYLKVAFTLGSLTGLEVGVFYIDALEGAFLPIFLILSVVKFALVVLFYMHLKYDSRLFSGVFIGGLVLAISVGIALMAIFQVLSAVASPRDGGSDEGARRAPLEGTLEAHALTLEGGWTIPSGREAGQVLVMDHGPGPWMGDSGDVDGHGPEGDSGAGCGGAPARGSVGYGRQLDEYWRGTVA